MLHSLRGAIRRSNPFREYSVAAGTPTAAQLAEKAVAFAKAAPNQLLIDGKWVAAADGSMMDVIDPRTEEVVTKVSSAGPRDVELAIGAARRALDGPWGKMTAKARGRLLFKLADAMEANIAELALLETLDNGKPLLYSQYVEVPAAIDHFRYMAGWADKISGHTLEVDGPYSAYTLMEPMGVVAAVIPWNFPIIMAAWKLGPALACGNTVVLKPAEQTPLTALRLGQLALDVGFPAGVINILTGDGPGAGKPLTESNGIDKISFTGSTEVGRIIGMAAAKNIKPVSLELGGKSPIIICADVHVKTAAAETHNALFFNSGQTCAAGSRVYVHEAVYDEFLEESIKAAKARRVGDPFGDVDSGPQVDKDQFTKIQHYLALGQKEGATVATGGNARAGKGYYIEPTIFTNAQDSMTIVKEEIFGPVQSIMKFSDYDEVLRRANAHDYGLAAGVFTNDSALIDKMVRALKVGTVWVNCYNQYDSNVPFGGYKNSGHGRDKGQEALTHFMQTKAVYQPLVR